MNAQASVPTVPSTNACASCGTEIPRNEVQCAICERASKAGAPQTVITLFHWVVFVVGLAGILTAGYILSP